MIDIPKSKISTEANVNQIGHFKELITGAGTKILKINSAGLFMGAGSFGSAPFRVDYNGNFVATQATITGTINASGGTISGDLVVTGKLSTGTSGFYVRINGNSKAFEFMSGSTVKASMYPSSSYDVNIDTSDKINLLRQGSGVLTFDYRSTGKMDITLASGSRVQGSAGSYMEFGGSSISFDHELLPVTTLTPNLGSSSKRWATGYFGGIDASGTVTASGLQGNHYSSDGTQGDDASSYEVVVDVRENSGVEKKYRTMTFKDGLLTNLGAISSWTPV